MQNITRLSLLALMIISPMMHSMSASQTKKAAEGKQQALSAQSQQKPKTIAEIKAVRSFDDVIRWNIEFDGCSFEQFDGKSLPAEATLIHKYKDTHLGVASEQEKIEFEKYKKMALDNSKEGFIGKVITLTMQENN